MGKRLIPTWQPDWLAREGLTPEPQPWEDAWRTKTQPDTFEWWYFDAQLDDGSTAVIVYYTRPFTKRRGPLLPTVNLTINKPDGSKLFRYKSYTPADFSASTTACEVRIGPNAVRGDLRQYELRTELDDLAARLVLTNEVRAWRPNIGKTYYDDALKSYFAWLVGVPYGRVTGSLTYGGEVHTVTGTGYHDHNWGNVDLSQVLSHWYWGRFHIGDYTVIFVEMTATPAYASAQSPILMVAQGRDILLETMEMRMTRQDMVADVASGHRYPRSLVVEYAATRTMERPRSQAVDGVRIVLRNPQVLEAVSLLWLPRWQQRLVRLFVNPYYYRFRADMEMAVRRDGQEETLAGPVIYELMILR
jgi:hypothetical protein